MSRHEKPETLARFVPTAMANLVPLLGVLLLGWQVRGILFVYWVEVGVLVVCYSTVSLFAQRAPDPEQRTVEPPTLSVPFLSSRSGSVQPVARLPRVHYRNVEYALGTLVFGLGFWLCLSALFVLLPSPDPVTVSADTGTVPLEEYVAAITAVFSPELLVPITAVSVAQFRTAYVESLGSGAYERLSTLDIAEVPLRRTLFWFAVTVLGGLVFPVVTLPVATAFGARTVTQVGIASLVVLANTALEYARFQNRRGRQPVRVFGWFVPRSQV